MNLKLATGFSVLLLASGTAAAQQTLTFSNTDTIPGSPVTPQVITLLGGSTVSIAPNGNLSASCVLGTGNSSTLCAGTGGGGPVDPPQVSLASSNFSNPPVSGQYPVTTSFTLTPTVTNAQFCVRTVSPTTPANTGWPATIAAVPIAAQQVFLRTTQSTYQFSLKCYNDSGSTTFTLPNIVTNNNVVGGGGTCQSFVSNLPSGWLRLSSPQSMPQVPLLSILGQNWNEFPNGGGRGVIATANGRFISLLINTPADAGVWATQAPARRIYWDTSQSAGEANTAKIYVTISECAGDFRLPGAGDATTLDPTLARGCRSYRPSVIGGGLQIQSEINYEISDQPSTETTCRLATGRSYHINFIRADVRDGSIGTPAEETGLCINPNLTSCGVDMNVE